jgi:hypothetical protein
MLAEDIMLLCFEGVEKVYYRLPGILAVFGGGGW